jgi:3',5'-cyclic AMP phosphodiesterase CpdA
VKSQLDKLLMPCYLIPGNHDDRDLIRAIFSDHTYLPKTSEFLHYVIGDYPVRLVGLDTLVPGQEAGLLCERRLDWIRTQLSESVGQPTLIFMHHPPFVTGIPAFDDMACGNGAKLGAILDQHPEVVGVLAGHVHRPISVAWHGTSVHVAPSVSFQYPLALTRGGELTPLPEPPACGIYRWSPDSGLRAHLSYIDY